MSKFQIKYLNLRARAEPIRMLLTYVQQPFEDSRENFLEYAKYKDRHPIPKLPRLVVDNNLEICYTNVIMAYLGRRFYLECESAEEKAICEMLGQRINDYYDVLKPWINCLLGLVPSEQLPALTEQIFIPCMTKDFGPIFEKQLEKTNTGFLVGEQLTWIDFYASSFVDSAMTYGSPEIFEKFPRIQYHTKAVHSLPQLQEYIKHRSETLF